MYDDNPEAFVDSCSWLKHGALVVFNAEMVESFNIAQELKRQMKIP
jgi:hypothetical protein